MKQDEYTDKNIGTQGIRTGNQVKLRIKPKGKNSK